MYSEHNVQCMQHTVYSIHSVQCTRHTVYSVHSVQCTVKTTQRILYERYQSRTYGTSHVNSSLFVSCWNQSGSSYFTNHSLTVGGNHLIAAWMCRVNEVTGSSGSIVKVDQYYSLLIYYMYLII